MSHFRDYLFFQIFLFGFCLIQLNSGVKEIRVKRDEGIDEIFDEKQTDGSESKIYVNYIHEIIDLKCETVFRSFAVILNDLKNMGVDYHKEDNHKEERKISCCDYLLRKSENKNCLKRYDSKEVIDLNDICDNKFLFEEESQICIELTIERNKQIENDINFFEITIFVALGLLCIVLAIVLGTKIMKIIYDKSDVVGDGSYVVKGIRYRSAQNFV